MVVPILRRKEKMITSSHLEKIIIMECGQSETLPHIIVPTCLASSLNLSFPTAIPTRLMHSMDLARSIRLDLSVAFTKIAFKYGITASQYFWKCSCNTRYYQIKPNTSTQHKITTIMSLLLLSLLQTYNLPGMSQQLRPRQSRLPLAPFVFHSAVHSTYNQY